MLFSKRQRKLRVKATCTNTVLRFYSFDFIELRFYHLAVHSSREATAGALSSAGEPGRCAKRYAAAHACRRLQKNRGGHGRRRSATLRRRLESAVLISRNVRERHTNEANHLHYALFGQGCAAYGTQCPVLHRSREAWSGGLLAGNSATQEKCAAARRFRFSPAQVSASSIPYVGTPAQLPHAHPRAKIRSGLTLSPKRSHCALSFPSAGADRCARRSRGEASGGSAPPHWQELHFLPLSARLSRSARRWKRVGRCGPPARPSVDRASARPARSSLGGSAAALSAASAAPPSVTAGKAAPLAGGGVGRLQRARMRLRSTGVCRR